MQPLAQDRPLRLSLGWSGGIPCHATSALPQMQRRCHLDGGAGWFL